MENKEFLNICYKFFNRFILLTKLIELLENMDKTTYDKNKIDEIIDNLKKIDKEVPNSIDEYVIKKKENLKRMIDRLESIPKNNENIDFINNMLNDLKKEYDKEIDSHERWSKVMDCITKNDYFNKLFDSLTDYELLEFIAQNINAPCPPQISQEKFDKLVKVGIENDKREWLWRLAFNYEFSKMNFDKIVDYYIEKKDSYYLVELISAVSQCLDIDSIIDKIKDKEVIEYLIKNESIIREYVKEEQFNKLIDKLDDKVRYILYLNIRKLHTTELGVERIKKNLKLEDVDVIEYLKTKILDENSVIYKEGKNYYCVIDNIKITINSYNYCVITAHMEEGK